MPQFPAPLTTLMALIRDYSLFRESTNATAIWPHFHTTRVRPGGEPSNLEPASFFVARAGCGGDCSGWQARNCLELALFSTITPFPQSSERGLLTKWTCWCVTPDLLRLRIECR